MARVREATPIQLTQALYSSIQDVNLGAADPGYIALMDDYDDLCRRMHRIIFWHKSCILFLACKGRKPWGVSVGFIPNS